MQLVRLDARRDPFSPQELLPRLLLVTALWIWWHVDRDRLVVRLGRCVENSTKYDGVSARDALKDCYNEPTSGRVNDDGRVPGAKAIFAGRFYAIGPE
jgi:hypothetical protein